MESNSTLPAQAEALQQVMDPESTVMESASTPLAHVPVPQPQDAAPAVGQQGQAATPSAAEQAAPNQAQAPANPRPAINEEDMNVRATSVAPPAYRMFLLFIPTPHQTSHLSIHSSLHMSFTHLSPHQQHQTNPPRWCR